MKLNNRGQMLIVISVIIAVVFATFVFTLYFMTKVNVTASIHDRLAARAIEVCDVGISQMIGDIHRHNVDLALLPVTTSYAIVKYPDSEKTEQVEVSLSEVPDNNDVDGDGDTTDPETDLAGNIVYQIDSRSWGSMFYGEKVVKRRVAARIAIVNLAKYNLFYRGNDVWANYSTLGGGQPIMLDGPYHTNGDLRLGVIYFNNQNLPANPGTNNTPGVTANAAYNQSYTVMCAKQILQAGGYPANNTYTQNNQFGRLSPDAAYNVVPNATWPRGTWFDGAHGGFEIHLEALDFVKYQSLAQVIIEADNLPNFSVYGITHTSTGLVIPNGAGDQTIDIDLSYLGSGTAKDVCFGMTNYQNALNNYYGLIIFVNGPVSVHGKIADCPGANNNKKITIVSTDSIDILGDVLYSQDPYMQILDSYSDNASVNAWSIDTNNANASLARDTTATIFTGAPYKNIDSSCMRARIQKTGGSTQATFKKHFDIVPPPAGINNSKIYFNVRGENAGDDAKVTLRLIDNAHNVIASVGPIDIDEHWKRIVLVNNTPSTTLSLSQINDFNNHPHDNLEIIFTNFDNNMRNFYIDELGFAFGKSYPLDPATTNPTNDAIALISQDNQYENAFYITTTASNTQYTNAMRADNIKYFAVNGDYRVSGNCYRDLRIDAFIYTALDNTMFTVHTNQWLDMFTQFGSSCSFLGGSVRAPVFNSSFDTNIANNVSKAIPVGTVIHSYQQLK